MRPYSKKETWFYVKQFMRFLLHTIDMISDITYICTVPIYYWQFKALMILSIFLPICLIATILCNENRADSPKKTTIRVISMFFGVLPLYNYLQNGKSEIEGLYEDEIE